MMILLFIIAGTGSQGIPTPASLLGPNHFNYHPYQIQFLRANVQPTKQGPVLFPNDGPPPPKPPLVVTSRPLIESIARSDLTNNSIAEPQNIVYYNQNNAKTSQNLGIFDQNLLQNLPEGYNNIEYQATSYNIPYNERARVNGFLRNNGYDYEAKPVYYTKQYINDVPDADRSQPDQRDQEQYKNYAFSYTVRDQKTGDDFSHSQRSSGSATNGEYRVLLPDGRIQIVSYTADENGYKANVRYDEEKTVNTDHYNVNPNNYNNPTNNYNSITNQNYNTNKEIPVKEETDYNSKEYYDYSSEYTNNYQPYKTKFTFTPVSTTILVPTARPYTLISQTPVYSDLVVNSNNQVKYDATTEKVVLIGNKNVYSLVTTPKTAFAASTPASYLASTIASLRDRIAAKSVGSNNFINRIGKYLSFK